MWPTTWVVMYARAGIVRAGHRCRRLFRACRSHPVPAVGPARLRFPRLDVDRERAGSLDRKAQVLPEPLLQSNGRACQPAFGRTLPPFGRWPTTCPRGLPSARAATTGNIRRAGHSGRRCWKATARSGPGDAQQRRRRGPHESRERNPEARRAEGTFGRMARPATPGRAGRFLRIGRPSVKHFPDGAGAGSFGRGARARSGPRFDGVDPPSESVPRPRGRKRSALVGRSPAAASRPLRAPCGPCALIEPEPAGRVRPSRVNEHSARSGGGAATARAQRRAMQTHLPGPHNSFAEPAHGRSGQDAGRAAECCTACHRWPAQPKPPSAELAAHRRGASPPSHARALIHTSSPGASGRRESASISRAPGRSEPKLIVCDEAVCRPSNVSRCRRPMVVNLLAGPCRGASAWPTSSSAHRPPRSSRHIGGTDRGDVPRPGSSSSAGKGGVVSPATASIRNTAGAAVRRSPLCPIRARKRVTRARSPADVPKAPLIAALSVAASTPAVRMRGRLWLGGASPLLGDRRRATPGRLATFWREIRGHRARAPAARAEPTPAPAAPRAPGQQAFGRQESFTTVSLSET